MPATNLLPYAEVETPEGVTELTVVRVRPDVRTIYLPPLPPWRISPRTMLRSLLLIAAFFAAVFLLTMVAILLGLPGSVGGMLPIGLIGLMAGFKFPPLPRRLSFQVNAFEVRSVSAGIFGTVRTRWDRSKIRSVKADPLNNLVISLVIDDPAVIYIGVDPTAGRVADELTAALAEIPASPGSKRRQSVEPWIGLPPGPARTVLHRLSVCLSIAAAVGAPFTHGWSLCLFLPAAVVIGIAMGSR